MLGRLTRINAACELAAEDGDNKAIIGGTPEYTMEYHIALHATPVDLDAVDEAVRAVDPAALVDLDRDTLRVSTYLRARELTTLIAAAGYPLEDGQLAQLPSTCCGGCSG